MEMHPIPVLIVDDDPTVTVLLKGLLRNLGSGIVCATTCVASGAAARIEFAQGSYQLVLLDYLLPDDDGLTLLEVVNALPATRRPVVIMLTGGGNEQVAVEAMKRGAKDYLVKSAMNLPALRRAIIGALERHQLEEQLARSTEEVRRHNEQMEADLAMAREVQQALLPQHYPVLPAGAAGQGALHFSHCWIPSHEVAGDYFAVFPLSPTTAGVFLCDVMGHGVRAALITTLLRGLLREHQTLASQPGDFMAVVNRELKALLERAGDLVFVTAVYLVADAATGDVALANAGHPWPLHLQRGRGEVQRVDTPDGPGPALGLIPDADYPVARLRLEPNEAILLYTDGIYEVEGPDGEEFGRTRLKDTAQALLGDASGPLLERLLVTVKTFRNVDVAAPLGDDVCLVAVDFRP